MPFLHSRLVASECNINPSSLPFCQVFHHWLEIVTHTKVKTECLPIIWSHVSSSGFLVEEEIASENGRLLRATGVKG